MNFGSIKKRFLCDFSDLDIDEIEVLPALFLHDADFLVLVEHKNRFDMTSHKKRRALEKELTASSEPFESVPLWVGFAWQFTPEPEAL